MTELDELERQVLSKARSAVEPAPGSRDRSWALLTERIALAPSTGALAADSDPDFMESLGVRMTEALWSRAGTAILAATVAGAVGFGAGYWARGQHHPAPLSSVVTSPAVPSAHAAMPRPKESVPAREGLDAQGLGAQELGTENPSSDAPRELAAAASASSVARGNASPRAAAGGPGADQDEPSPSLGKEVKLLRRVDTALRSRQPMVAIGLLGELDKEFPTGQLREERSAARVAANCQLVGGDAARRAGREFLEVHRSNAYAERVRHACGLKSTARE